MKITLLQTAITWRDLSANIAEASRLMDEAPGSDVYVLPEMWASGFEMQPDEALGADSRKALAWMREQAQLRQCAVVGSLPWMLDDQEEIVLQTEHQDVTGLTANLHAPYAGTPYAFNHPPVWCNRLYFVMPDGHCALYDKWHLFGYGGETEVYTPGSAPVQVTWHGVRFCLQICFDLRYPESSRNAAQCPYDVLLTVANWPTSRREVWDVLLRARAIENQCYAVGVNRTGEAEGISYNGGSTVVDPYGKVVAQLDASAQTYTFSPDLDELQRFRAKFPVLE